MYTPTGSSRGGNDDLIGSFDRFEVEFRNPGPLPERQQLRRAMSSAQLFGSDDPIEEAELQWRLISPVSVLVLALLAVGMSRINPRHGPFSVGPRVDSKPGG